MFITQNCFFFLELVSNLASGLQNYGLIDGSVTLQDVLMNVICKSEKESNIQQIWSTMPYKLHFPECRDRYIPPRFKIGRDTRSFTELVNTLIEGKNQVTLVHAPPGMGKSRATEEIHQQLVVRMPSHVVLLMKLSQINSYLNEFDASSEEREPSALTFLGRGFNQSGLDNLSKNLKHGTVFVIVDGLDEVSVCQYKKILNLIKIFVEKGVRVLLTSRVQEREMIISHLPKKTKTEFYEIDELDEIEKVQLLQTRLGVDQNTCKDLLHKFKKILPKFSRTPFHLGMMCTIPEIETIHNYDIYGIYEEIILKKIEIGLFAQKQTSINSSQFCELKEKALDLLSKCAVLQVVDGLNIVPAMSSDEILAINWSGLALVDGTSGQIHFLDRSIAEYLTARLFFKACFNSNTIHRASINMKNLFGPGASVDAMKFIESGLERYKNCQLDPDATKLLVGCKRFVFERICKNGMVNLYKILLGQVFDAREVKQWMEVSYRTTDFDNGDMGLFSHALSASDELTRELILLFPEQARNFKGWNALHKATVENHMNIVEFFLNAEWNPNEKVADNGKTCLHLAAENESQEVLRLLLMRGADANLRDNLGTTPLHIAAQKANLVMSDLLLIQGADPNCKDLRGFTALHLLTDRLNFDDHCRQIVNKLQLMGVDFNAKTEEGENCLSLALRNKNIKMLKCLLEICPDVLSTNFQGKTVLHTAAEMGFTQVLDILTLNQLTAMDLHDEEMSSLLLAIANNHLDMVKLLVNKNLFSYQKKDNQGRNALHLAVDKKLIAIVKFLLNNCKDWDINEQIPFSGYTCLHLAASGKHPEMVKLLLAYDANPNEKNATGFTPLHCAVAANCAKVVKILLNNEADRNLLNDDNKTALDLATDLGLKKVHKLLADPTIAAEEVDWEAKRRVNSKKCLQPAQLEVLHLKSEMHRSFTYPAGYDSRAGISSYNLARSGFYFTRDYFSLLCFFCTLEIRSIQGWKNKSLEEITYLHKQKSTQKFGYVNIFSSSYKLNRIKILKYIFYIT